MRLGQRGARRANSSRRALNDSSASREVGHRLLDRRTTRRGAGGATARSRGLELPADVLGLVLYQLPLAHDIAAVAPTCQQLCAQLAARLKLRPFSSAVVHARRALSTLGLAVGRVHHRLRRTGTVKVCPRFRVQRHRRRTNATSWRWRCCRRISLSASCERSRSCGRSRCSRAAFEVGEARRVRLRRAARRCALCGRPDRRRVRLYHVDGTLVVSSRGALAAVGGRGDADGQHIISGSQDKLASRCGASPARANMSDLPRARRRRSCALAVMPDGRAS